MDSIGYQILFASPTSNEIATSLCEGLKFSVFVTLNEYISTPNTKGQLKIYIFLNSRSILKDLIRNCAKVSYIDFFLKRANGVVDIYLEEAITTNLQDITGNPIYMFNYQEIIGVDRFSVSYRMYLYVLNTSFPYYLSLFFVHSSLHLMSFCWKFITYFVRTWLSSSSERIFYQNNAVSYLASEYASFINRILGTFISCIGMYGLEALGMAISAYFFPDLDVKSVDLVHDLGFRYFI